MTNPTPFTYIKAALLIVSFVVALYIGSWLLIYKIFGQTYHGYASYRDGQYGTMSLSESYFYYRGYDRVTVINEPIFNPLNSFTGWLTFREKSFDPDYLTHTKFAQLLASGKISPNGTYRWTIRHMTIYIARYSPLGFHSYHYEPAGLVKP